MYGITFRVAAAVVCTSAICLLLLGNVSDEKLVRKYLMVHTDDAGMCHSMNEATIRSLENGLVNSASIMAPCPGFDEFAVWAAQHPEYDYGVHLTLTNETRRFTWGPLLPPDESTSLRAPDGHFWRNSTQVAEHAKLSEVEKELRAQIDKVLAAGIKISHLDNHMYSLLGREDLIKLYVKLGLEYDLPVRFRRVDTMPLKQRGEFVGGLLDVYAEAGRTLDAHQMPIFTFAESDNYDASPDEKRNHFLNAVRNLPEGVTEFVIHCGMTGVEGPEPPYVSGRMEDFRVFQSPEMLLEVNRLGISTLNWQEFRERRQQGEFALPQTRSTQAVAVSGTGD